MNLLDLLGTPVFAQSKVIAGSTGLQRSVTSVNIMDAPDIIDFLKPGELLLTTAYVLKDRPDSLEALVFSMHEVGCAGLAVKTKRFLPEIPQQVLTAADRLGFPIIELPLENTLGDVVHQSVGYILEKKTEELKYALESHRRFSDIVMSGKGLQEIIHTLSVLVGEPLLLLNQKLLPLAASPHFQEPPFRQLSERIANALPLAISTSVPYSLSLLEPVQLRRQCLFVYPIHSYQGHGVLIAFGSSEERTSWSMLAMEQAVNVIRFEMLKTQAVKERSRRYKNEFFEDLTKGQFLTEQEVIHRGRRYGLTENRRRVCVVGRKDPPRKTAGAAGAPVDEQKLSEREWLYDLVKSEFQKHTLSVIMFMKNNSIAILVTDPPENGFREALHSIVKDALYLHGVSLSFGVGKQVEKLLDIPITYKEALEALEFGFSCHKQQFVQFYHGRELIDLFRLIHPDDLQAFCKDTFQPLESLEEKERTELLRTLQVYYDHHCSIAETAKTLFIHRNTVIYRLDKCRQLFAQDMNAPAVTMRIRSAFLMKLLV